MFWANCSFAHFLRVTWANRSRSLICLERPERLAHGSSFPLSDLSDSLTVAHLSWAIWANRSQSLIWFERNEGMSEFPALKNVAFKTIFTNIADNWGLKFWKYVPIFTFLIMTQSHCIPNTYGAFEATDDLFKSLCSSRYSYSKL